jgi:hypothetical protein
MDMILSKEIKILVQYCHNKGYTNRPIDAMELFNVLTYFNLNPAGGANIMRQLEQFGIYVEPTPGEFMKVRNLDTVGFNGIASERVYIKKIKTKLESGEPVENIEPKDMQDWSFQQGNAEARPYQDELTTVTPENTKRLEAFEKHLKKFENGEMSSKKIYEMLVNYYDVDLKKVLYDVLDITDSLNISIDVAGKGSRIEYREFISRARRRKQNFEQFNPRASIVENWNRVMMDEQLFGSPNYVPFNQFIANYRRDE